MTASDKLVGKFRILVATLVGTLALTSMARAVQTTTTPNAAFINYGLNGGTISGAITPPSNQSVLVMGCCTTSGVRGVGEVTMLHAPAAFLEWVGINSTPAGNITNGFSSSTGQFIVQIDFSGNTIIEVQNADSFRVHNTASTARAGNITMLW